MLRRQKDIAEASAAPKTPSMEELRPRLMGTSHGALPAPPSRRPAPNDNVSLTSSTGSELPQGFVQKMRKDNVALREKCRELEREVRKYRSELASSKAQLACVTEDSEEVWQRLADVEEQAASANCSDFL